MPLRSAQMPFDSRILLDAMALIDRQEERVSAAEIANGRGYEKGPELAKPACYWPDRTVRVSSMLIRLDR